MNLYMDLTTMPDELKEKSLNMKYIITVQY